MAANSGNDSNGVITGINVTPLVDIMLVLLIIFMVTAKLVVAPAAALPLQLPKASTADAVQVVFSISLLKTGGILVNGRALTGDDALLEVAKTEKAEHPEVKAVIQADGRVLHERVIHVMDLLSQADISQIAFAVQVDAPGGLRAP